MKIDTSLTFLRLLRFPDYAANALMYKLSVTRILETSFCHKGSEKETARCLAAQAPELSPASSNPTPPLTCQPLTFLQGTAKMAKRKRESFVDTITLPATLNLRNSLPAPAGRPPHLHCQPTLDNEQISKCISRTCSHCSTCSTCQSFRDLKSKYDSVFSHVVAVRESELR